MKHFGITVGDPCGIGPEITLKALKAHPEYQDQAILFGTLSVLEHYNKALGYDFLFHLLQDGEVFKKGFVNVRDPYPCEFLEIPVGKVSKLGGKIAFLSVKAAIEAAQTHVITSVVTAPLNKEALHLAGYMYAGHTEIFAAFTHGSTYAMLLWSDQLKVIHVSTHVSLRRACDLCTKQRVSEVIALAHETLKSVGYDTVRIAVAGLNPHAGENGLFGDEEIKEIIPAIQESRAKGMDVEGPIPPDTVFLKGIQGSYDIIVAMYHDQGHIPLKILAFDSGVNITVGLDVIRTSVDHGTAFDIAGKLIANEASLLKAIEIGQKL